MARRLTHERHELANAALDGVRKYLSSTRGCATLGGNTFAILSSSGRAAPVVEVTGHVDGEPVAFQIVVMVVGS